ncbi:hemolysin XhlA family protein [Paenibacillus rigui]|uniref:Hemolysin XhlA n=1 Tax=Paenibacillus rigui TaxID=554312 RepID=A0A229UME3_9BACL|nr:hemolysin XhlA family protein [Paenibacillus rigui]OXM84618.1 hemolysin XhlA [Paenibacillus rigui]
MSPQADETQEILQRLTRVETKLDMMNSARDTANDALQSTKAAHKRLDTIEENQKWIWRTVVGAMIVGVVNLLLKVKGM